VTAPSADADGWARVARPRTYELVIDRIEQQLASGRLRAGDRLPAERDLAATLGVSRAAVREAIRVLEAMGLVVQGTGSGPGAGTILTAAPADALTRLIRLHVLVASVDTADVVRARIALERESARLAATHATAEDRASIDEHLSVMDAPDVGVDAFNEGDTALHLAIARASGNQLVAELTTALRTAMRPTLLRALVASDDFAATTQRLRDEHHGIARAIRDGDGTRAADLVEAHIEGFYGPRL
jgi:GntR family transcriptional regulator, transcriptional repressor for pyruvate dehydrogenase complex